jgi:hypothetical protein
MFYAQTRTVNAWDLNPKGKKRMNTFKKIIGSLFKAALLTLLLLILIPVLYFAWRATQPMELPEFNELSYVQYTEWRKLISQNAYNEYVINHPGYTYKSPDGCTDGSIVVEKTAMWYLSTEVVYAQDHPEITTTWDAVSLSAIPTENTTVLNVLPQLWLVREKLIRHTMSQLANSPVPFCRQVNTEIPTPGELDTMKQTAKQTQLP